VQVASGKTWQKAAVHAVLGYRFQIEERIRDKK
jgi:hypothetical protein